MQKIKKYILISLVRDDDKGDDKIWRKLDSFIGF